MKNLNEVQAQFDLLEVERSMLRRVLDTPQLLAPLTLDAVYQLEQDFFALTAEVQILSWVIAQ